MSSADPAEILAALASTFRAHGIRWYLFGAHAVGAYGVPRLTADVDATIEFPLDAIRHLADLMEAAGFARRVTDVESLARQTRVLPLRHVATGIPVDVVLAGSDLEEAFLSRARETDVGGVTVPVIAPEDLIATKVLAGRSKDIEDVSAIIRGGGTLDLGLARETLRVLDVALDRDDLVRRLDSILAETEN